MSGLISILRQGAQLSKLDDDSDAFKLIGDIGGAVDALRPVFANASSPVALFDALVAAAGDQAVRQKLADIGLGALAEEVSGQAEKLIALRMRLGEQFGPWLQPIGSDIEQAGAADASLWDFGSNSGRKELPLFGKQVGSGQDGGKLWFSIEGGAGLVYETGALWPFARDNRAEGLFRIGARGNVNAKLGSDVPFLKAAGAFGVDASAGAAASAQYFFAQPDPKRPLAAQLALSLRDLANPFDYAEMMTAMSFGRLQGVVLDFEGAANLDVSVTFAKGFAISELLQANVALTVDLGVKRGGRYTLSLQPAGAGKMRVRLSQQRSREKKLGVKLGIEFDATAIAGQVQTALKGALKKWEKGLDTIEPFLTPGTYLREKLGPAVDEAVKDVLKDGAIRAALTHDIGMALGLQAEEDESAVEAWLKSRIEAAADKANGLLAQGDDAGDALVDQLVAPLSGISPAIAGKLADLLTPVADKLKSDLTDQAAALVSGLTKQGKIDLGKHLKDLGADVNGAVGSADDALKAVRSLIGKYDKLFKKIVAEAENQARYKIALRISYERSKKNGSDIELDGVFSDAGSEAAAALYRAITHGELDEVAKVFINPIDGFALDAAASALGRFGERRSNFGYAVVVLGFGMSSQTMRLTDASVHVTGDGVMVVDGRSEFAKQVTGIKEGRSVQMVSAYELRRARQAAADALAPSRETMQLSIAFEHKDKDLELEEADRMFADLEAKAIATAADAAGARGAVSEWTTPGKKQRLAADVAIKIGLDGAELERLLFLDVAPGAAPLAPQHRRYLALVAMEAMIACGVWSEKERRKDSGHILANLLTGMSASDERSALIAAVTAAAAGFAGPGGEPDATVALWKKGSGGLIKGDVDELQGRLKLACNFVRAVDAMRAIYLYDLDAAAADPVRLKQAESDLRALESILIDSADNWLKVGSETLGWFKARAAGRTLALMTALRSAAQRGADFETRFALAADLADGVTIQLTKRGAGGEAEDLRLF